jgi:hypothetical protein
MILIQRNLSKVIAALATLALFATPAFAEHGRGQRHDGYNHGGYYGRHHGHHMFYEVFHPYPFYGKAVFSLPGGFVSISTGGSRYYYQSGIFYKRYYDEYVVVAPPAGAVIATLPPDCHPVIIGGVTYYTGNGVYYATTPEGYEVVSQPRVTVIDAPKTVAGAPAVEGTDAFTVNIPAASGGYTPVVIMRSGDGFVGPQGEFYPTFPSVEQLKVMYGEHSNQ